MLYLIRFYEPGSIPHFSKHEEVIATNIKEKIGKCEIRQDRGRFYLETDNPKAIEALKEVQGITSFSPVTFCHLEELTSKTLEVAENTLKNKETFAVRLKRHGEHPFSSHEMAAHLGREILKKYPNLKVDLKNPKGQIFIEVRDKDCFIFTEIIRVERPFAKLRIETPKFISDDMLGKLSRRLRILGYDSTYISGVPDFEYIKRAREEGRTLLTRDTFLAEESGIETLLIKYTEILDQLKQVLKDLSLKIDPKLMFGRCSICNIEIDPIEKEKVKGKVPEKVYEDYYEFHICPKCKRIYWKGSHYDKMMKEFSELIK